ncbi:MAG: hypothetical protein D4R63_06720 [Methylococcaceae bacterium]|nr:MAG: hypothetical protein D4R63_06720 [Methylococcaceae bacterium]
MPQSMRYLTHFLIMLSGHFIKIYIQILCAKPLTLAEKIVQKPFFYQNLKIYLYLFCNEL